MCVGEGMCMCVEVCMLMCRTRLDHVYISHTDTVLFFCVFFLGGGVFCIVFIYFVFSDILHWAINLKSV